MINKNWKEKYHTLSASYEALFNHNPNITYTIDLNGKITHINEIAKNLLGYDDHLVGKLGIEYVRKEDRRKSHVHFLYALKGKVQTLTIDIYDHLRRLQPFRMTYIPILMDDQVIGVHGVGIDLAEQKRAESTITELVHHDLLTGVANRVLFEKSLSVLCLNAQRNHEKLAIIFLDIDRFKHINDTVGHTIGDQILKLAVNRIQEQLEPTQLLARFTGDKFSILVPNIQSRKALDRLIFKIRLAFVEPLIYDKHEFFLSVSMGVSLYPDHGINEDILLKNADIALDVSKIRGDNSYLYYSPEMDDTINDRLKFEAYLRRALSRNEFVLHYQPQICLSTGKVVGCEALIRWKHPKLGIISPTQFIPLAEEIGLIEDMGLWVLRTACRQINQWNDKGMSPFPISINVSAKQFMKANFVKQIVNIISGEGIDPKFIHIEITESTTLRDIQYSIGLINDLKAFGVSVSLDDFGTGYSALSYLKDFSIDILKIDRAFIQNIKDQSQDRAIVKAIITMCEGLSLKTIAEGVETEEQLKLLQALGCHVVQGFFYSKPLPEQEFEAYIRNLKNPA